MDTEILIDKITKAISHKYKTDPSAPGLQISTIKTGYYVSIVRYGKPFGKEKKVLVKATSLNLKDALKSVAQSFLDLDPQIKDPVQDLGAFVKDAK